MKMSNESSGDANFTSLEHRSYEGAASTSTTVTASNIQFSVPSVPIPTRPPQAIRKKSLQLPQVSRKRGLADINGTIDKLSAVHSDDKEDEFDCFRKLDALMCMEIIQNVMGKKRLQTLKNASPMSSSQYSWTLSPAESVPYSPPPQISEPGAENCQQYSTNHYIR